MTAVNFVCFKKDSLSRTTLSNLGSMVSLCSNNVGSEDGYNENDSDSETFWFWTVEAFPWSPMLEEGNKAWIPDVCCVQVLLWAELPEASREEINQAQGRQLGCRAKLSHSWALVLLCFMFSLELRYFCESLPLILNMELKKKTFNSFSLGIMQQRGRFFFSFFHVLTQQWVLKSVSMWHSCPQGREGRAG